jgi:hypothetical protein
LDNKARTVRRIILGGAVYDIMVTGILAVPPLTLFGINVLFAINNWLGFSDPPPVFDAVHLLFVSLFGLWVMAWAIERLRSANLSYVRFDLAMRIAVLVVLLWYVVTAKTYGIINLFIAADILCAAVNWWGSRMLTVIEQERKS